MIKIEKFKLIISNLSDGLKVTDHVDTHLKNATGILSDDITILTLAGNIDVADIHMWDSHLGGKN